MPIAKKNIPQKKEDTLHSPNGKAKRKSREANPIRAALDGPYLRVGTRFFKNQEIPTAHGYTRKVLTPWQSALIKADHGTKYLNNIPKFEGFVAIPKNQDYQRFVDDYYNIYEPIPHSPEKGACKNSLEFARHVFGEHYEIGLDYLQLLYTNPIQRLPILCLVSKERGTGKSTFIKWLARTYGANVGIYTNADLDSRFNEDWNGKLLICVDETSIEKKAITERLKYLTFTDTYIVEGKGKARREIDFFAKFILASNNERNFLLVDDAEVRFWVRKVKPFRGSENVDLLAELTKEIPAFLHFLAERKLSTERKTRMWFTNEQIETEALSEIKKHSKGFIEKELRTYLSEQLKSLLYFLNSEYGEGGRAIYYTASDLLAILKDHGIRASLHQVSEVLKEEWNLSPRNSSYKLYSLGESPTDKGTIILSSIVKVGRHYTFTAADLLSQNEIKKALQNPITSEEAPY